MEEFKRLHTLGHYFNVHSQLISPKEAQKLSPILDPNAFYGGIYSPTDGHVDPTSYCNALIKGGIANGGQVLVTIQLVLPRLIGCVNVDI